MKNSILLICFLWTSLQLGAQNTTVHYNLDKNKVAVEGYDLVAYFKDQKAIKGNTNYSVIEQGVTYYFVSQNHKDIFKKNPSFYQPQHGGWCAYAIGKTGEKVAVDPKTFKVIDNKLYLFYNKYLTNTLKLWNKEEAFLLNEAEKNWKKIVEK